MQHATTLIDKDWQFVHGKEPYFSSMLAPLLSLCVVLCLEQPAHLVSHVCMMNAGG